MHFYTCIHKVGCERVRGSAAHTLAQTHTHTHQRIYMCARTHMHMKRHTHSQYPVGVQRRVRLAEAKIQTLVPSWIQWAVHAQKIRETLSNRCMHLCVIHVCMRMYTVYVNTFNVVYFVSIPAKLGSIAIGHITFRFPIAVTIYSIVFLSSSLSLQHYLRMCHPFLVILCTKQVNRFSFYLFCFTLLWFGICLLSNNLCACLTISFQNSFIV